MTVATNKITSGPYAGNDVTVDFDYDFRVNNKNQLIVFETNSAGIVSTLTVDTDYTVNDVGVDGGGTITRIAGALPTGSSWYIRSNYDTLQGTAYESQGAYFPGIHENSFDKLHFLIQQLYDIVGRSFRLSDSDPDAETVNLTLPEVAERASRVLVFNSDGDLDVGALIGTWRGDWVTATDYNERDLFLDPATNNVYFVLADHTSTSIAADVTAESIELVIDASYVKTQADAAAASASTATTQAGIATTQAGIATTQAGLAADSATDAEAAQALAEAAQTAAEAAQTSTEAVLADFETKYLGAKAANPTLDNEGNALIDGAIYYNNVSKELRFYDLGTTSWGAVPTNAVLKTSDTGAARLPVGTTAERPSVPQEGDFRGNSETSQPEYYNGTAWGTIGGASGGIGNPFIYENDTNVTADYTITSGKNAMSAGPITIDSGFTVTVPSGSVWTIV